MKYQSKTKHALIQELETLRQRIKDLEQAESEWKKEKEVLKKSETRFRSFFDSPLHGIAITSPEKGWIQVNDRVCSIMGYSRDEIVRMTWSEMTYPDDIAADLDQFNRVLAGQIDYYSMNKRFIRKDGMVVWTNLSVGCVRKSDGSVDHIIAMIEDITSVKLAEAALQESENRYKSLFENVNEAIFVAQEGKLVFLNPVTSQLTGYSSEELMGRSFLDFIHPDDRNLVAGNYLKRLKGEELIPRHTFRYLTSNGAIRWMEIGAVRIEWTGRPATLNFCTDITDRKQTEEKIRQMASHDSLTGLPNRKLFSDRLGIALAQAQRNQESVAVSMLDLDNFKNVNDTLGHDTGDLLLKATAERLSAALRKGDTVARFGGDEFVLILPGLKGIEDAIHVAHKIVVSFRKPFLIDTHQLVVTMSIGIAVYPNDGKDEGILLKNADIAMYQSKQTGRDRYQIFNKPEDTLPNGRF